MKINQLDLFSGIGGFHLGFERAGYDVTSYFSEIDKHAIAVYKNQFKHSTYVGSVTDVRGEDLPKIDLITFGSPCQDFSLAGKRRGMEGERSSLITESIRLIDECRPSVFIWENVKGTFSSNDGEDFWAIIQAFTNLGGYRIEWQLLNTSWFLPQNRERIYLVGYSTATGGDWKGVFPIKEGDRGDTQQKGKEGGTSACITTSYHKGVNYYNQLISMKVEPEKKVKQIGTRLDSNSGTQPYQQDRVYDATGISPTLSQGKSDLIIAPEALFDGMKIRRLTPIECERLQGFPDNHTEYGEYEGEVKKMSNVQRYKQCGNAVTVDVVYSVALRCIKLFNKN